MSERTFERAKAKLLEAGRVAKIGDGEGVRYRANPLDLTA